MRDYSTLMKYRIGLHLGIYLKAVWRVVGPVLMSLMLLAGTGPTPCTLHPTLKFLTPCNLHPAPYTIHPKPL